MRVRAQIFVGGWQFCLAHLLTPHFPRARSPTPRAHNSSQQTLEPEREQNLGAPRPKPFPLKSSRADIPNHLHPNSCSYPATAVTPPLRHRDVGLPLAAILTRQTDALQGNHTEAVFLLRWRALIGGHNLIVGLPVVGSALGWLAVVAGCGPIGLERGNEAH